MDRNQTVTESKGVPEQASEPFSENGVEHGAVSGSPAAPGPPSVASAQVEGTTDGNAVGAAAGLPSGEQRNPNHGAGGKFVAGNRAALKHGLHAQQPPVDADVAELASASRRLQVLRRLFDAISRDAVRYVDTGHRLNARDQQQLLNMVERLGTIDGRIRELEAETPTASADDGEAPGDWPKRLALLFANEPDRFTEFATLLLSADRDRTGPLRQQLWLVLAHFDPQGVPKWCGKADEPDTVIL